MGPLIDAELEAVDRRHAQLTRLSTELVDALNLYHQLMHENIQGGYGMPMPNGGKLIIIIEMISKKIRSHSPLHTFFGENSNCWRKSLLGEIKAKHCWVMSTNSLFPKVC